VHVVVFGRDAAEDPEFAARVARHRADRPEGFVTLEADDALAWRNRVPGESVLVLDCLGTLLGRVMEAAWDEGRGATDLAHAPADALPAGLEERCEHDLGDVVDWLIARDGDTIVVTNEVGDGLVPSYATGRAFRDLLGRANRRLVRRADRAYLCVAGRLLALDALPDAAAWPED
jgi:adenosylcobinamide kinase/adenosylcobinamide-phosphate guanylyltransferase